MAVRSTPATRPTTAGDSIDEYFPLTREQLQAPAIPRVRLSLGATGPTPAVTPAPDTRPRHSPATTIAARTRSETQARATGPASPAHASLPADIRIDAAVPGHLGAAHSAFSVDSPDVRFAARTAAQAPPSLAEMAAVAFPPGQVPWETSPTKAHANHSEPTGGSFASSSGVSNVSAAVPRRPRTVTSAYPYWMVALIQILIGTLLVIMVVRFANARRETAATTAPAVGRTEPSFSGQPITWLGRPAPANNATDAGIFEF